MASKPFWETKSLRQMTVAEWDSLCDGCGLCCLIRFEDEDSGEIIPTRVACKMFDAATCRCTDYANRADHVPDCIQLTPAKVQKMNWLPATCGYRLVAQGKDLYWWHPLKSGSSQTVHQAGISAAGRVISEKDAGELEDHVVYWLDDKGPPKPKKR